MQFLVSLILKERVSNKMQIFEYNINKISVLLIEI
jgi:hypothetical protein